MADKKKAYAYLRVSTLKQVDGKSLEGQLEEIKNYCTYKNIELVQVYSDEGKSGGSIKGRPKFQEMLNDIAEKHEVDYVLVWKLSRFGRNACDSLNSLDYLHKHGVEFAAVQEQIDTGQMMGQFIFTLLAALAEMERENIKEQTRNGKKYTALSGGWNGGSAPYGYRLVNKKLVINDEEADIVRKIYDWYLEDGASVYSVTARLNKEGIKPRETKRIDRKAMQEAGTLSEIYHPDVESWYKTMTRSILSNPVYYGKIKWKNNDTEGLGDTDSFVLADGQHKAIISEEIWNKAQEKRKKLHVPRGRKDSESENIHNVFNGIAKCPHCGGNMTSHTAYKKNKAGDNCKYHYYICGYWNNHKGDDRCSRNAIKAELLEGSAIDAIKAYVNRPNVIEEIKGRMELEMDTSKLEGEITEIRNTLKGLEKAESVQYDILSKIGTDGKYKNFNPDRILVNIDKIVEQRDELEVRLQNKEGQLSAIHRNKIDYEMIKGLLVNFNEAYDAAPKDLRKRLVRSLVKEIRLGYDERGKVIPVSLALKFSGEQIELVQEHPDIFELNGMNVKECSERRILCGNASHFQGDERDVIFLSVVDCANGQGPVAKQTFGVDDAYRKRYNVAVSRAKDQLWVVDSLDSANDLKPGDIRKMLIDFSLNPESIHMLNAKIEEKAESPFEAAVAQYLAVRGYHLVQQWEVGAYRLDMVAVYGSKKIVIECDGERYHSGEDKIREDMERQTILERLGWRFIRIRGSEYYRNPEKTMERVVTALADAGIEPEDAETPRQTDKRDTELLQRVKQRAYSILREDGEVFEGGMGAIAAALDPQNDIINAVLGPPDDVSIRLLQGRLQQREQDSRGLEQSSFWEKQPTGGTELKQCERSSSFPLYQAVNIDVYIQKYLPNGFKEMVKAILEVEAPLSEALLLSRIVQCFDRKRVTNSVWNDYELKMRGCQKYGIICKKGFLYLDGSQDIQFRVPGDIARPIEYIAPEELAAGMFEILKCNGLMEKKDLYRNLAGQCGVHRLGKEIEKTLDKALHTLENSIIRNGEQLLLK